MAHLQPSHFIISKGLLTESSCSIKGGIIRLIDWGRSWKNARQNGKLSEKKRRILERERGAMLQCCCCTSSTTSSSSAAEEVGFVGKVEVNGKWGDGDGNLVSEYGWNVRMLVEEEDEMRKVAQVQAEAFHVPVALFNDLFFQFFQAEVLSGLIYKLRNSPPDRYACLVAESNTDASESRPDLVGVVDVTVLRDEAVLQHLQGQGATEYLYVSGIAVLNNFRRQKVATALLKACDMISILWGFEYLALRAYEDDCGARKLYTKAGYRVVAGDSPWTTTWIGRKRREIGIEDFTTWTKKQRERQIHEG